MSLSSVSAKNKTVVYDGVQYRVPTTWRYTKTSGKYHYYFRGKVGSTPFFYLSGEKAPNVKASQLTRSVLISGMESGLQTKVYNVKSVYVAGSRGYLMDAKRKISGRKVVMRIFIIYQAKSHRMDYISLVTSPSQTKYLKTVNQIVATAKKTNAKNRF